MNRALVLLAVAAAAFLVSEHFFRSGAKRVAEGWAAKVEGLQVELDAERTIVGELRKEIAAKDEEINTLRSRMPSPPRSDGFVEGSGSRHAVMRTDPNARPVSQGLEPTIGVSVGKPSKFPLTVANVNGQPIVESERSVRVEREHHIYHYQGRYEIHGRRCLDDPYVSQTIKTYTYQVTFSIRTDGDKAQEFTASAGDGNMAGTAPRGKPAQFTIACRSRPDSLTVVAEGSEPRSMPILWRGESGLRGSPSGLRRLR